MSPAALGESPFRGLAAFEDSELDALLFFGRERDVEIIAANLVATRLTVLFGPSGAGKSSVLRAGVVRHLRALPDAAVVVHDAWGGDPLAALRERLEVPQGRTLVEGLAAWTAREDVDLYLLLDQFEELFTYHGRNGGGGALIAEVAAVASEPGLRVNVLLAVRDDLLASLDVFKGRVRNVFGNSLRLDRLDREAGRAAIVGPLARWRELGGAGPHEAEPELVEAVLDQVASPVDGRVEAPFLQLVLERLWELERDDGSPVLRRQTLEELGGADAIVRSHLDRAVEDLSPAQRDLAARAFNHLVTPSGTKVAHGVGDLAGYAGAPPDDLAPVLATLGRDRILRPLEGAGDAARYEIFHDVLADPVLAWRGRHEAERAVAHEREEAARRHRRVLGFVAVTLAALAVVAAVAIYALLQRSEARDQARHARARELAGTALGTLDRDPQAALRQALLAARLDATAQTEDVLRRALLGSHLRLVTTGSPRAFQERGVIVRRNGRTLALDPVTGAVRGGARLDHAAGRARLDDDGTTVLIDGHRLEHPQPVRSIDVHDDLVLTSTGHDAWLWDARSGRKLQMLTGHSGLVFDARFDHAGSFVATASSDGTARIWNPADGTLLATLFGHGNYVTAVRFSPDDTTLATVSRDGTARLWEVPGGRQLAVLAGHRGAVTRVAFSPDGELVVTGGVDGSVRVWEGHAEPQLRVVARATEPLTGLRVDPGGVVVARAEHGTAGPLGAGARLEVGPTPEPSARSADGTVASVEGRFVRLHREGSRDRLLRPARDLVDAVAFSPDGTLVATASRDHDARLYDVASGRLLRSFSGQFGALRDVAFSADGRWLVTNASDAALWETASGRLLGFLRLTPGLITGVRFAADGQTVYATANDGTLSRWLCDVCVPLPELERLAAARLAAAERPLTAAQRRRLLG